ncbi:MAG: TetR family transcriptional regulator [Burkholderiales bacterium]|jgi:AcrR family transcriptional regulator
MARQTRGGAASKGRAAARTVKPARRGDSGESQRLGPDQWLDAAHAAVVAGGFGNVRVLPLAQALGITRGSFYWHFADHAELVAALIGRWHRREIEADRALEAASSDDPLADLLAVLDAALARGGSDLADLRFELALRSHGRQDPAVAEMLAEVDALRLGLIAAKYRRILGGEADAAEDLAALLYVAVAGAHQALARPGSDAAVATYLRDVIAEHLILRPAQPGAPQRAAIGRRRGRGALS